MVLSRGLSGYLTLVIKISYNTDKKRYYPITETFNKTHVNKRV